MKKLLAILLALSLCLSMFGCTAQEPQDFPDEEDETTQDAGKQEPESTATEPEPATDPEEPAGSTPLLYKVTTENGGTVWLFGSIHVGIDEMYPLPDYVMDAYMEADALAVECDVIAAQEDTRLMVSLLQNMIYTDGTTIADYLSPELYTAAVEILEENGSYLSALDYYYPVLWFSFIESFSYANYGYDSEAGIDMFLLELAKEEGKDVLEVESVTFQYNMLASFSPELQVLLLEDAVNNYGSEEAREYLDMLLTAWCQGDEDTILALLNEESTDPVDEETQLLLDEYNTAMLTDRNIAMTDYVESILQSGDRVFVCVGMAHILGDGAIIDLLQQRGYTVEPVY